MQLGRFGIAAENRCLQYSCHSGSRDSFLKIIRADKSEDLAKPTAIPTARYPGLFNARLKYSSTLTVHPAPKFSGRRAGIGVRGGALMRWDNIVLNIGDEEKQVALRTSFDGVCSEMV